MERKTLFEQVQFPKLTLKNRFVRSGLWMKAADEQGHITPDLVDTYKALADGGVGLIITEYTYIDANDQPNPRMIGMYDDSFIPEWNEIIAYAHSKNVKIACQIAMGGSQSGFEASKHRRMIAPSAVLNRVTGIMPEEMTETDFQHVIDCHAKAALRVRQAGFDAVQIHAAHGYLLSQFLTPYYNRRTDREYRELRHSHLSVLISGTPGQVKPLIPSSENGLFSRQMFYYMPRVLHWINQFSLQRTDTSLEFQKLGKDWIAHLREIQKLGVISLRLTDAQIVSFNEVFQTLFERSRKGTGNEMNSSVVRMAINIGRILSIVALLRRTL